MAVIPPFFLDCIVAIGFPDAEGNHQYAATGFIYGHFVQQIGDNKEYKTFLVTNRHVVQNMPKAYLRFNPEGTDPAREYDLNLLDESRNPLWLSHSNPDIDIAVVAINASLLREHHISFNWFQSDAHAATRAKALELGMAEGDTIFVLGFPLGLIGETRSFAIVRHGVVARIRDCLSGTRNEFLIDCSIFPGNSGGPVVTRPEVVSIQGTMAVGSAYLIGVVASYVPYQDVAISAQTKRARIIFEENSGLASVFPIDYVDEIISAALARGLSEESTTEDSSRSEPNAQNPATSQDASPR